MGWANVCTKLSTAVVENSLKPSSLNGKTRFLTSDCYLITIARPS